MSHPELHLRRRVDKKTDALIQGLAMLFHKWLLYIIEYNGNFKANRNNSFSWKINKEFMEM